MFNKRIFAIIFACISIISIFFATSCTTSEEADGKSFACIKNEYEGKNLCGFKCDTDCVRCEWYPMYFGCSECGCGQCVICGFDCLEGNCFEVAEEGLYSQYNTIEAQEGVDYEIIMYSLSNSLGIYGTGKVTDNGLFFESVDWVEFIKALQNPVEAFNPSITITVKIEVKSTISAMKFYVELLCDNSTYKSTNYFPNERSYLKSEKGSIINDNLLNPGIYYLSATFEELALIVSVVQGNPIFVINSNVHGYSVEE
ncbi:MAG: hypothetical protein SPJ17_01390 [Anaeroplasma sp.]|uniref:hypothetical protein n=1 Tax=Anaeroplasma sp. TaxID=1872523 RepID=UPI002A91FA1B|nr:hypothetical protein [Anaeroplasma sp.]MDY5982342.1 hypothetical protein [Anaeroplasma sp.]